MTRQPAFAVLIAEQDPITAILLEDLTRVMGYAVLGPVRCEGQARDCLATGRADVAIVDAAIVRTAGQDFHASLERDARVVVLTADEDDLPATASSEWPVIRKPFDPRAFTRQLACILNSAL